MGKDDLRWMGPGYGRNAPSRLAEQERRKAELAPANAARREAFARARPAGFEIPAMLGTSLLADIPAGLTGLATAPFVGAERAAENVQAVQNALTYQPRGDATASLLEQAAPTLQKVDDVLTAPARWVGDVTGSPGLATAAHVAPDAAAELLGGGLALRAARRGPSIGQRAVDLAARYPAVPLTAAGAAGGGLLDGEEGATVGGLAGLGLGLMDATARRAGSARPANVPQSQAGMFMGFGAAQNIPDNVLDAREWAVAKAREGGMGRLSPGSKGWHAVNQRIHEETGQRFGPSGAIHFGLENDPTWEVPDLEMVKSFNQQPGHYSLYLGNAFEHPGLQKHYPELANRMLLIRGESPHASGEFDPRTGNFTLFGRPDVSTLGHEVGHGIQRLEGWDSGTAPSAFPSVDAEMARRFYLGNIGEMQARAIPNRMVFSQGELANKYPMLDYMAPRVGERTSPGGKLKIYPIPQLGQQALITRSPHWPRIQVGSVLDD